VSDMLLHYLAHGSARSTLRSTLRLRRDTSAVPCSEPVPPAEPQPLSPGGPNCEVPRHELGAGYRVRQVLE